MVRRWPSSRSGGASRQRPSKPRGPSRLSTIPREARRNLDDNYGPTTGLLLAPTAPLSDVERSLILWYRGPHNVRCHRTPERSPGAARFYSSTDYEKDFLGSSGAASHRVCVWSVDGANWPYGWTIRVLSTWWVRG